MLQEVEAPEAGRRVPVVGARFRFDHDQPRFQGAVPRLGEQTDEVLRELND